VIKDGNQSRLDMGRGRLVPLHDPSLPAKAGNPGAASPVLASPVPASTLPAGWRPGVGRPELAALDHPAKPGDDGFSVFGRDKRAAVMVKGTTRRDARGNRPPPMTSLGAASAWRFE
jgi:hypothetical protein